MKLRSHRSAPPSKRKNLKDEESSIDFSSDDDSSSSDSNYSESSVEDVGESSVRVKENRGVNTTVPDLNLVPDDVVSVDSEDSEPDYHIEYMKFNRKKIRVMVDRRRSLPSMASVPPVPQHKGKKRKRNKRTGPPLLWEVWEQEQERWVSQNMNIDVNLESQNEVIAETVDEPSDLVTPLLKYQKEWLSWALKQEESETRGGILADEMGMGKTVQAIALVLAKRELLRGIHGPQGLSPLPSSSTGLPGIKATLVICPVVAVKQWVNEIERFTAKGSNKILIYHGPLRGKSIQQFSEYDFIITTYSIVESEYRKNVMPPKQKCQWCDKSFYDRKLIIHLKYFCGPDAKKTAKQSKQRRGNKQELKKPNQKSVYTVALEDEVNDGKKGTAKKKITKKNNKGKEVGHSSCKDDTAANEVGEKSILHSLKWDRIILDEAHYIKDRRSNTAKAVLSLESSYKWALSGTPLQNRVGELYSLVRFLQIVPYSYYFCKDCDCRVLDYGSTQCTNCPHKSVRHFCWWNKNVATPIQYEGNIGGGRNAMILLKHKVLKGIVLRRTKKGRAADLALPPRIVTLRRDTLDIREEDYYTSLYNESQSQFNTYIDAGTLMNNYAHIFDLLTRLRQAVDHPYLVVYSKTATARRASAADVAPSEDQICELCHEEAEDPVVSSCEHAFCKSCLIDFSASMGQVSCPTCSKPLTVDFSTNAGSGDQNPRTTVKGFRSASILNRICLDDFQTSTKIDALREEIRFMVERDGSAKGIVFSQFTSFLDLIHYSLQKSGISCVQLVGSMTMNAREAAISKFINDSDCKIFLMSLKAGGVALNLTVASHVFLMDPWWNPAVERQAQDRIHRIGQYKPIRIVKFVIENTIEERILKLQEKKQLVFEGTVGGSSEALGKLTEADLKFLFVT